DQRDFLDLLLVAIAEHGMMPTNVAGRMTLAADPGSLQGAVAAGLLRAGAAVPASVTAPVPAGILGAGPVILGTSEQCALLLERAAALMASGAAAAAAASELAGGIRT